MLCDKASRRPDSSQPGCDLDEHFGAVSVNSLGQISPPGEYRSVLVDSREHASVSRLSHGRINSVAYRNQAGCKKTYPSFRPGKEVLEHFLIRTAGFFAHHEVSHWPHDNSVFNNRFVDFDRRKELLIGIEGICEFCIFLARKCRPIPDPIAEKIIEL